MGTAAVTGALSVLEHPYKRCRVKVATIADTLQALFGSKTQIVQETSRPNATVSSWGR